MYRHWLWVGACVLSVSPALAQEQKIGAPPEASNMKLVGWNDLQARSAYQPTIHKQGERYIAYIGHHGGTDDVPTPVNPMTGKPENNGSSPVSPRRSAYRSAPERESPRRISSSRRALRSRLGQQRELLFVQRVHVVRVFKQSLHAAEHTT